MQIYFEQITKYLFTQSWQIAILVAVIAAISFVLKNKSAHVRYLLWLIVLAKCIVPPLFAVPLAILPPERPGLLTLPMPSQAEMTTSIPEIPQREPPITVKPIVTSQRTVRPTPAQTVALLWLTGAAVFLLVAIGKAIRTNRWLKRRRRNIPANVKNAIERAFTEFGLKKYPRVWLIEGIGQPFVWGLFRGSIYLPAKFASNGSGSFRRDLLGHELCHILRFDAAVNLLQVIAQAIFWFHPFVWWANRRIRAEREKCCDEMAIARIGVTPKDYSTAIVNILISEQETTRPVPSLAVAGPVKNIEERIKTMLRPGKKFYKRPSLIIAVVLLMSAVLIVPISCTLTSRAKAETAIEQEEKPSMYLVEAALAGDLEEVKRLIAEGADVNATSPEIPEVKFTPIMAAANRGHAQVAQVLLENGAEVNATDFQGWTALYYTFWIFPGEDNEENHRERVQLVKALIASGADVNKQCQGISPLINAISTGTPRLGSIEALLDAGADIHFKDNRGLTPLYWAAFEGDRDVLDLILERGDYSDTIHLAACRGDLSRVKQLVEQGKDVNTRDECGCTPMHWAVLADSPEVAEFLISRGADVNAKDARNFTPLMGARGLPVIELLISKGADISAQEGLQGSTKLHMACSGGDIAVATFLLDKGADIHARNRRGATPLWVAAVYDQKEIVELLLERGANINALDRRRQCTPLWIAVRNGNKDTVELLIEKGANLQTPDNEGRTPLAIAKQRGHTEIVDILRKHGAKEESSAAPEDARAMRDNDPPAARVEQAKTPAKSLHEAAADGNIEQVKSLISKGADVNAKDYRLGRIGMTPLHYAARGGHKDIVELLIAEGADVNAKDKENGITPVIVAMIGPDSNRKEIVQLLIENGAQVSSLHALAFLGNLHKVKTILKQSADINAKGYFDGTPLHFAVMGDQDEMVKFLIDQGADVNAKAEEGLTPLHAAMVFGDKDMVKLLIDKGADVKAAEKSGIGLLETLEMDIMRTLELLEPGRDEQEAMRLWWESKKDAVKPLVAMGGRIPARVVALGASMGLKDMIELAINAGADVNARAQLRQNKTLLHEAVDSGEKELVQYLLDRGADINAKDRRGWTPLHMAAHAGKMDIVQLLLAKGADPNIGDIRGGTALWYAKDRGHKEIVALLHSQGAKEQEPTISLHQAARDGDLEQVKSLISRGADVNTMDDRLVGTPLHLAAYYAHHDVVEFLISKGADINARNKWNRTAIDEAVDQGHDEIAELLRTHGAQSEPSAEASKAEPAKSLLESAASKYVIPKRNLEIPEPMQSCAANLRKIYEALKKYEKDKGTLPNWLSDLVPDYVSEETLLCPHNPVHTGRLRHDPRLPCSYGYEFRMDRARVNFRGSPLGGVTMRDWKTAEMRLFGDVVPLVRCYGHGPILNLTVSGKIYLSGLYWPSMFIRGYKQYEIFKLLEESSR